MKTRFGLIAIGMLLIKCLALQAQLLLHPSIVFLNQASRTGSMVVVNNSNEFKEINISLRFGYLTFDSLGNKSIMKYDDSLNEKKYSLVPYIKVYPPKLLIPPNQTASIRFIVRGVPDSVEQIYWTRILASAVTEAPQLDTALTQGELSAKIMIKSEFNGFIAFMSGKNTSDIDVDFINCYSDSNGVNLLISQNRTGNSPFWGTMFTEIFDSNNKLIDERSIPVQTYFNCVQNIIFEKDKIVPGRYTAKLTVTNERTEVPPEFRPKSTPKTKSFVFQVK